MIANKRMTPTNTNYSISLFFFVCRKYIYLGSELASMLMGFFGISGYMSSPLILPT